MTEKEKIVVNEIKSQIYELYNDIKECLSKDELDKLGNGTSQEITCSTEINVLINFLKNYIKLFIKEKKNNVDKNNNKYNKESYTQLESYITKLENDIKYYMKKQFQNKIQKDSLEMKIRAYIQIEEEYEDLKEKVKYDEGKFLDNDRKDNEIIILRKENSLLKKEIIKLERDKEELTKLKEKNKELEDKKSKQEEIIKGLKNKITQLNDKLSEMEEELNNTKKNTYNNEMNTQNQIENTNNLINLNDGKSRNKIEFNNISARKISLAKYSLNKNNGGIKQGLTNYKLQSNYESTKSNHSHSTRTIDTNKYIISTYNKKYNHSLIGEFHPFKNDIYQKYKKSKNNSMKDEDYEKSELMNKYLSGSNTQNKYVKQMKSRSLNKMEKNISIYKFPLQNNIISQKNLLRDPHHQYKSASVNILAINKKNNYG